MTDIRNEIIELAKMKERRDIFIIRAMEKLLALLEEVPKSVEYEFQWKIAALLSGFSAAFLAALAVRRMGRPAKDIAQFEEPLLKKSKSTQIRFITGLLFPLCSQANEVAFKIATFFLWTGKSTLVECAEKEIAEASRKNELAKSTAASVLKKWIPARSKALDILKKVDPEGAMKWAVRLLTHRDSGIRYEAFRILSEGRLTQEISDSVAGILKSDKATVIWDQTDHRAVCCDFVSRAFEAGFLAKDVATELLKIVFQHEYCGAGLSRLLPALKVVCPGDKQILMDGFIGMEKRRHKFGFSVRDSQVETFVAGLTREEFLCYLKATIPFSDDSDFCLFAGKHLIGLDIAVASRIFAGKAKEKVTRQSISIIGELTWFAAKICDDKAGKWEIPELNKKPNSRFFPVADALLRFAEEDGCPTPVRLAIAFQPGMHGGNTECCRRTVPILKKIILSEDATSEQARDALRVLIMNHRERGLAKEVNEALEEIYASPCKKILLDQILFILTKDVRGWLNESLYPTIISFLESRNASEAVPILKKALNAERPTSDYGMDVRAAYVNALKKFALKGSKQAVSVISEYQGGNINNELIPKTLVDIHKKTVSPNIKTFVSAEVARRFLSSIGLPIGRGIFYLHELEAMENLKDEPCVQRAFLDGLASIGDIVLDTCSGVCGIVGKATVILPKEKIIETRQVLKQLLEKLGKQKQRHLAMCDKRRWGWGNQFEKNIDSISAEATLTLAMM
jgi:hypothetical protein